MPEVHGGDAVADGEQDEFSVQGIEVVEGAVALGVDGRGLTSRARRSYGQRTSIGKRRPTAIRRTAATTIPSRMKAATTADFRIGRWRSATAIGTECSDASLGRSLSGSGRRPTPPASVDTSNPAINRHFTTGHFGSVVEASDRIGDRLSNDNRLEANRSTSPAALPTPTFADFAYTIHCLQFESNPSRSVPL